MDYEGEGYREEAGALSKVFKLRGPSAVRWV